MRLINVLKEVFKFYINSSIHVSLAVVALSVVTMVNFQIPVTDYFLYFIFFASVTGYNFVKYAGIAKMHHLSLGKQLRVIQLFSLLAFVGMLYTLFFQPASVLITAGFLGLLTLLYALPVFSESSNLRSLSGVKIYVIATVWAGATVLLPLVAHVAIWGLDVIVCFVQRFFLVLAITLPFEIRDLRYDMVQLRTIPQQVGVLKSRVIGFLVMYGFLLLEFLKSVITWASVLSVLLTGVTTIVLLRYSRIRQSRYYASFWVEGIPLLWLGGLLLLTWII